MLRVFGCMVASRGGYRMPLGWHYAKLSLSNAPRLSFSDLCILLFLFLSLCRFCVFVFFFCSHWSLVDVSLIFFCPADHVPDWQPRVLLGMVEARSVNVKKTTTHNNNNNIYLRKENMYKHRLCIKCRATTVIHKHPSRHAKQKPRGCQPMSSEDDIITGYVVEVHYYT